MSDDIKTAVGGVMTAFEEFKSTNDARLKEIEKRGAATAETERSSPASKPTSPSTKACPRSCWPPRPRRRPPRKRLPRRRLRSTRSRRSWPASARAALPIRDPAELKNRVNVWARAIGAVWSARATCPTSSEGARRVRGRIQVAVDRRRHDRRLPRAERVRARDHPGRDPDEPGCVSSPASARPARSRSCFRSAPASLPPRAFRAGHALRDDRPGLRHGRDHGARDVRAGRHQPAEPRGLRVRSRSRAVSFEATEQFAVKEGAEFVSGSGVGPARRHPDEFEHCLEHGLWSATTIADANGQARRPARPEARDQVGVRAERSWALNRTTLGSVRKLKDNNKQYIWQPGISERRAEHDRRRSLRGSAGHAVRGRRSVPDRLRRLQARVRAARSRGHDLLRDQFTQATSGNIRFLFRRRVGGSVVLSEAIRLLKCST
jgi:hypothetical protein